MWEQGLERGNATMLEVMRGYLPMGFHDSWLLNLAITNFCQHRIKYDNSILVAK